MIVLLPLVLVVAALGGLSLALHTTVFLAKVGLFVIVGAFLLAALGVIGAFVSGKKGRE